MNTTETKEIVWRKVKNVQIDVPVHFNNLCSLYQISLNRNIYAKFQEILTLLRCEIVTL